MPHKPIQFEELSLIYPHKTCFEGFSGQIQYGDRIAIIGRNGAGKSTLLKMLYGSLRPTEGEIKFPQEVNPGYLPQIIGDYQGLSGGQRLNHFLTKLLAANPNLLLLDEPTNHLDNRNRRSLIRMLKHYHGTLIIVSHDMEIINGVADTLWHIDAKRITVFSGRYQDYQQMLAKKKEFIEQQLDNLSKQRREVHLALMREQERNKRSRIQGEKHITHRKWPTIRSYTKLASSVRSGDKRLSQIREKKQTLFEQLSQLHQPEVIQPKFKLNSAKYHKAVIAIQDASVSHLNKPAVLSDINLQVNASERVALCGDNGSGKSTLAKAILDKPLLIKKGVWAVPDRDDIGYLDQHYDHLAIGKSVLDAMRDAMPKASDIEIREHLNDFLFRKNQEIQIFIEELSGGEKVRLSLALIAANPPKLLILDELTNNLDLETRAHVIQVLRQFRGAMIVISHDNDFLEAIHIGTKYLVHQGKIRRLNDALRVIEYE